MHTHTRAHARRTPPLPDHRRRRHQHVSPPGAASGTTTSSRAVRHDRAYGVSSRLEPGGLGRGAQTAIFFFYVVSFRARRTLT